MKYKQINQEVLASDTNIAHVNGSDIAYLKRLALKNDRKRVRLCTHRSVDNPLHEMLIVHTKDTYVRPHKHIGKSESFHIIEGLVDVIIFDDSGNITDVINMGDYQSGRAFYQRIAGPYFHTLIIKSHVLVFHEITNGPFNREDTVFPPWAPEDDTAGIQYINGLKKKIIPKTAIIGGSSITGKAFHAGHRKHHSDSIATSRDPNSSDLSFFDLSSPNIAPLHLSEYGHKDSPSLLK
jgi:cupin fold WbuC family metalloprotein